jgi:hypothetical protein
VLLGFVFLVPTQPEDAILLVSMAVAILRADRPQWTDEHVPSLAIGATARESLTASPITALMAIGFLG